MNLTKHDVHLIKKHGFIPNHAYNIQWYKVKGPYFTFIWMNKDDWEVCISDFGNARTGLVTNIYDNRYKTLQELFDDISNENREKLWSVQDD
ncbi:hypothetical protein KYI11_10925 [Macrococcoides bohemicum]|uniref:Uncharacterized protein n=1 Tax=Macrococcoides bohemicum TaxID=1903056 RepID=A0AAJ4P7T8_9STAP|nr:hypothetical protein [Macrococcus bohemicus]QYA42096.1 hypothetical protein KYI11_10925 [Macrococcus bohemicus]